MERIEEYVRRDNVWGALRLISEEKDGVTRAELLAELLKRVTKYDEYRAVKDELLECTADAPDRKTKALILSIIGEALLSSGDYDGVKFFEEAISTARRIGFPLWRAEAFIGVALNLIRAGIYEDAYSLLNSAFEGVVVARTEDPDSAIRLLRNLADSLLISIEWIDDGEWAKLYLTTAAEVYEYIGIDFLANSAKAKAWIIDRALEGNTTFLRRLLAENRVDDAILMARYIPREHRGMAFLEIAFWLYANDYPELGRDIFNDATALLSENAGTEHEIAEIARDFLKLGYPDLAFRLTRFVENERLLSELLTRIAAEYHRQGDELMARTVAMSIPNETIKSRVVQQLGGGEHVGYEQGLQVAGGGKKR
ncbi:hypothetical protein A3L09_06720 [Thermococcus profundus]|uniref:Uncharacterized protein n=1 Tax=Thermococcus profundus TaxID=49899 RepID=A0A2Z2MMY2_THEPR|nr:hypothetical protein A3L09_06720 [Thermococcus profundus]